MSDAPAERKNPFVGPRSFQEGEPLYGRNRETVQLANLLIAERIILLYSPSGAGKTSLIQAALLPKLKTRRFVALPVVRVNLEPPAELAGVENFNRYTFSVLSSLEQHLLVEDQLPDAELAKLNLAQYFTQRRGNLTESADEKATILVFDQFEEILTIDVSDLSQKQAFFAQLGSTLEDPNRWALFSMREDYIAGLDPYLLAVPTHFRNTFRLDLLSPQTVRQVLQQTTLQEGVTFTDEAADKLIADLSRVRVQKLNGTIEDKEGVYVEPVQMQVVCYNMWEKLDPDVETITLAEIEAIGDVDQALGDYYSAQVEAIAKRMGIPERTLRRWFDQVLITPSGIRNQVLLEQDSSQGLSNDTIYRLEDAHLVRLESGRNRTWVELAHDRLVAPVRRSNAGWFEENLSLLQRQASIWHTENRAEHLLLRGESLLQAQAWAREHAQEMLPEETEFLEACLEAEAKEKAALQLVEAERRAKTQRRFLLLITLALAVVVIFAISTYLQRNAARSAEAEANTQREIAVFAQATATNLLSTAQAGSTVLAQQAINERATGEYANQQRGTAEAASSLAETKAAEALANEERANKLADLAFSRQLAAQGSSLLTSQTDLAAVLAAESYAIKPAWENKSLLLDIVQRRESQNVQEYGPPLPPENVEISAFAISPDGERLAWGTLTGRVSIWNYRVHNFEPGWDHFRLHSGNVLSLDFSPDGSLLASGGIREQQLFITNVATQERVATLASNNQTRALAFHPDQPLLAVAVLNRIDLWDTRTWQRIEFGFDLKQKQITDLAWSPDGTLLAYSLGNVLDSATPPYSNEGVGVWSLESKAVIHPLANDAPIFQVSWSPDGSLLAGASRDGNVRFWDVPQFRESTEVSLPRVSQPVFGAAFSPDGKTFTRGDADIGISVFSTQNYGLIDQRDRSRFGWIRYVAYYPKTGFNLLGVVVANDPNNYQVQLFLVDPKQPLGTERVAGRSGIESLFGPAPASISPAYVTSVDWSKDGSRAVIRETSGKICVLDIPTGEEVSCLDEGIGLGAVFSPDGERVVSGGRVNDLDLDYAAVWDASNGTEIAQKLHTNVVTSAAFSPDGQRVISGDVDGIAVVWEAETGREISEVDHGIGVQSVVFSPDGGRVASGSEDGTILVWDADTGDEITRIDHGVVISSILFSPDGDRVYAGSYDGSVGVWEAATGKEIARMSISTEPVASIAITEDGSMLASGGAYGNLILWDLASYQPIGAPLNPGHLANIALAFSPDGRRLQAGYEDGSLWEWNVDVETWVGIACEQAGTRTLTAREQAQYFPDGGYQDYCGTH